MPSGSSPSAEHMALGDDVFCNGICGLAPLLTGQVFITFPTTHVLQSIDSANRVSELTILIDQAKKHPTAGGRCGAKD
jgi:hypothetical protein